MTAILLCTNLTINVSFHVAIATLHAKLSKRQATLQNATVNTCCVQDYKQL